MRLDLTPKYTKPVYNPKTGYWENTVSYGDPPLVTSHSRDNPNDLPREGAAPEGLTRIYSGLGNREIGGGNRGTPYAFANRGTPYAFSNCSNKLFYCTSLHSSLQAPLRLGSSLG